MITFYASAIPPNPEYQSWAKEFPGYEIFNEVNINEWRREK